jgi:putative PIG3 family NAD(P)H quinone oxidoreductase
MRAIRVTAPGGPENLSLVTAADPIPASGEILVKVKATALNRADILQRRGKYPPPQGASDILGLEFSGEVMNQVGSWRVGDRVMGILTGGGYAEYLVTRPDQIMPIPQHLSWEEAAAIPEAFLTAYQTARILGKLKKEESILIHAGGSGVGTAAIQLAKKFSAKNIITTAGSAEKLERCRALGATRVINYKEEDFGLIIQKETAGVGVDVLLDFIGAEYFHKNIDSLATDGRWILIGSMGGLKVQDLNLGQILSKRLSLTGTTLRARTLEYKADLLASFRAECETALSYGELRPIVDSVFDLKEAEMAHRLMEANKNFGKIILRVS